MKPELKTSIFLLMTCAWAGQLGCSFLVGADFDVDRREADASDVTTSDGARTAPPNAGGGPDGRSDAATADDSKGRDGSSDNFAPPADANDAQPLDAPASDVTASEEASIDGSSTVDAGSTTQPDGALEDAARSDAGGGGDDAGSIIDVSVDAPTSDGSAADVSVTDAPRVDGAVDDDGPTGIDTHSDTGSTPDSAGPIDAAPEDATPPHDVASDENCIAETDQQLCARLGKSCEPVSGVDNCGTQRTPNCGTCSPGNACVDHVCQPPVCPSFNYASSVFSQFSITDVQEYIVAASPDHGSVIYVQSPPETCPAAPIYLADETSPGSGTYTSRDITTWWQSNSVGWATLMTGGRTLITSSTDVKSLGEASRSALQRIDMGAVSTTNYTAVNAVLAGTSGTFNGIAVSANGLELYAGVTGISTEADGIYRSTRNAIGAAFSSAQRIPTIDSSFSLLSGISSDRLTLFVGSNWAGYVFTRNSTSAEFSNPNGTGTPPMLQGWQHKPGPDCALFATYSPGGCLNQEIMHMTRQ